jgi:tRNA(fMet)-specific endonuclease VapC
MSLYVLDTDILSLYQTGHPRVVSQISHHAGEDLCITILSVEEQLSGWYTLLRRTKDKARLARIYERMTATVRFLSRLEILSYSEPAIDRFELIRALKLGVKAMDLRIAAVALESGATVVTRNLADFRRVPGLRVEDWSV